MSTKRCPPSMIGRLTDPADVLADIVKIRVRQGPDVIVVFRDDSGHVFMATDAASGVDQDARRYIGWYRGRVSVEAIREDIEHEAALWRQMRDVLEAA